MIETEARVVRVDAGVTWVEARRLSACGHCSSSDSCGTSLLGQVFGNRPTQVRAQNPIDARVGDSVILGLPEQLMISGSVVLYLFPLLGLFAGAVLGEWLAKGMGLSITEPWAILAGLLGVMTVLLLQRRISVREKEGQVQAVILRKLSATVAVPLQSTVDEKEK
jgi:sigma-E factor negative regulatory protein RseC